MVLIHAIAGILLLLCHAFFLFRGLAMRKNGRRPTSMDRIARAGSHFGLPVVIATGFFVRLAVSRGLPINVGTGAADPIYRVKSTFIAFHAVFGLLPIVLIFAFAPLRSLKRRIPWLLPSMNLLLFMAAAVCGMFIV